MQVDEEQADGKHDDDRPPGLRDRVGEQRRDAEARDRHESLRHARKAKRRQRVPERRVDGRPRPEREQQRDEGAKAENRGECVSARPDQQQQTGERDERRRPPEEDELLAARVIDLP